MLHIFTTPLSLLTNAVMTREHSDPLNLITKQMVELDACTHCGTCSALCSVGVWSEGVGNPLVLPSEKIAPLRRMAGGNRGISRNALTQVRNGLCLCTNCHRCTEVCPAGINLQELWFSSRETALGKGSAELSILSPLSYYRALRIEEIPPGRPGPWSTAHEAMERVFRDPESQREPIEVRRADKALKQSLEFSKWTQGSSSYCFTCMTCSSVCPVVRSFSNPVAALGLTPHQIIHAANLGLPEMVFRSPMLWACTGCYQCQEACPQGVRVADVFYRLKNMAAERINMKEIRSPE